VFLAVVAEVGQLDSHIEYAVVSVTLWQSRVNIYF
jgi:hypothetical protein